MSKFVHVSESRKSVKWENVMTSDVWFALNTSLGLISWINYLMDQMHATKSMKF